MLTREEAIKAIEYIRHVGNGEAPYKNDRQSLALDMAIEALQERKTEIIMSVDRFKYCPHCGAKMEVGE